MGISHGIIGGHRREDYNFPPEGTRVMVYAPDPSDGHRYKRYARFLGAESMGLPSAAVLAMSPNAKQGWWANLEFEDNDERILAVPFCCYVPEGGKWVPMDRRIDVMKGDEAQGFPLGDGGESEPC